jgi:uncharacterized C2H2 Zn-finger protein
VRWHSLRSGRGVDHQRKGERDRTESQTDGLANQIRTTDTENLLNRRIIMDDIHSYVVYSSELHALICRSCKYGLNPNGVDRHLRKWHKAIPLELRKRIVKWCDGLPAKPLSDVQIPMTEVNAIEGLKVTDGSMCLSCGSLFGTRLSMMRHCQTSHEWTISKSNYNHLSSKRMLTSQRRCGLSKNCRHCRLTLA